jgi:hypothetical protein
MACVARACLPVVSETTVAFPSSGSLLGGPGASGTLGAGGGGRYFRIGNYVEESFARTGSVTGLSVNFRMSDATNTFCGAGTLLRWAVKLNGTTVGQYSWTQGTGTGDKTIIQSWTFAAVSPAGGMITIRYEALDTVCSGGGSWNWYPGGTATMR